MKRYLVGLAVMVVLEILAFMIPFFRQDRLLAVFAAAPATAVVLAALYPLWPRLRAPTARLGAGVAGAWLMMLLAAVLLAVLTPDPLAPQRIAVRGWARYVFVDKALGGLLSGLLWGTVAYVWLWLPFGWLTAQVMNRVRKEPPAPAARRTPPPRERA